MNPPLPYVYIAGPYSKGDMVYNVRTALEAADTVINLNAIPFVPHLTMFWEFVSPKSYSWWLWYDRQWLKKCDALLRLPGESKGSDDEVEYAEELGIPVAYNLADLKKILKGL